LQLSTSRPAADDDRTTAANAERCGTPGLRTRAEGARQAYTKPCTAPLATSLLASPVHACWLMHSVFRGNCRSTWRIPFGLSLPADLISVFG